MKKLPVALSLLAAATFALAACTDDNPEEPVDMPTPTATMTTEVPEPVPSLSVSVSASPSEVVTVSPSVSVSAVPPEKPLRDGDCESVTDPDCVSKNN